MKSDFVKFMLILPLLAVIIGCEHGSDLTDQQRFEGNLCSSDYAPVKIELLPLTEIVKTAKDSKIKAYVSLMDSFDSQVKYPAVFRFELYEKLAYSGQPKGKRLVMWPDIDLTLINQNTRFWQDTFRAYKFDLDFELQPDSSYLLQITCMLPNSRRLTTVYEL